MIPERVKRLRDALNLLVIQDEHAETCMANGTPPRACTCGYLERLGVTRAALVADDDAEQTKAQPDLIAMEAAARTCVVEAAQWKKIATSASKQGSTEQATKAQERSHAAELCAHRIRQAHATYPVPANKMGSEADLATRWRNLLYAESRLQAQRDEILDTIQHAIDTSTNGDGEVNDVNKITAAVQSVLDDQVTRPSPDLRALLVNAHAQIIALREAMKSGTTAAMTGALKEALRLTDAERLDAWPPWTLAGIALRHVVDGLLEELTDVATGKIEPDRALDDVWLAETVHDLRDARDRPDEYMNRKQTAKALGFDIKKGDEHRTPSERDARDAAALKDLAPSIVAAVTADLKTQFPIPGESEP